MTTVCRDPSTNNLTNPTVGSRDPVGALRPPGWAGQLRDYIEEAKAYGTSQLIDSLPWYCEGTTIRVPITVEEWSEALELISRLCVDVADRFIFLPAHIDLILSDHGFDLRRVRSESIVNQLEQVVRCPAFIRNVEFLTPAEKLQIAGLTDGKSSVDLITATQRCVVEIFRIRREGGGSDLADAALQICSHESSRFDLSDVANV